MNGKDDPKAALESRQPAGAVPLREVEFHLWDQASGEHLVLGRESEALWRASPGHCNTRDLLGPPEKIREATRDLLEYCKRGGGLVRGAGNAVFRETPIDHYRTMLGAWRDHGSYR